MDEVNIQEGGTSAESHEAAAQESWLEPYKDIEGFNPESFKRFENDKEKGIIKSYIELEKKMGSMTSIPSEDDVEGWSKLYSKLGRPESPDKYEIPTVDGVEQNQAYVELMKNKAHELGLTNRQLQEIARTNDEYVKSATEQQTLQQKELNQKRREALGWEEDKWKESTETLRRLIDKFEDRALASEDDIKLKDVEEEIASNPKLVALCDYLINYQPDDKGIVRGEQASDDGYKPQFGPETYTYGSDPESLRAREYYKKRGHVYEEVASA